MEELLMPIFGLLLVVLGIWVLRREKRLFEDSVTTIAKLYNYYTYRSEHNSTMYTMEVEYTIEDGTVIHTKGQSSSNRIKFPVGTELKICYSAKKPELFIICGDNTRKHLFFGMIVMGIALLCLFGYSYFNGLIK